MVQRKVPNKLCIQTDDLHVIKSENRLGNLRPSSPQHQDSKNKGTDLKKKMKKSRSNNRTDFESLKSSHTLIKEVPQPGKPPPSLDVSTPQKQSPVKGSDASPNYMKSTSSFDARKERSQVNPKSSQSPSIESKSPKKISNSSRLGSVSGHKPGKSLTRTSSLKLVRTLTKSPTFKPVRVTTKKCSQVVVLCENMVIQRATCSSTLKDSKFPTYLALSPGATETEGTSAMKVCPYTYCSLNGHRHAPLPPLKCFITERRRMLKAQKSMKLGCLSPRRVKPSSVGGGVEEISKQIIVDEMLSIQGTDSNGPEINHLVQEEDDQVDFFVEIYAGNIEEAAEKIDGRKGNGDDDEEIYFAVDENGGGKVVERCSNEALGCEIKSEDSLCYAGEVVSPKLEAAEEVYSASPTQHEEISERQRYGTYSEESDMEWEEGQRTFTLSPDDEDGYSSQKTNGNDLESGPWFGHVVASFGEETVFKSDDIFSSYFDEISADEDLEGFFQEGENSDSEDSYQNPGSDESLQVFNNHNFLVSLTNDAVEDSNATRDGNDGSYEFMAAAIELGTTGEPNEEPREGKEEETKFFEADSETPTTNFQLGYYESECSINIKDKPSFINCQENQYLPDSKAGILLVNQEIDSSQKLIEMHQDDSSSANIEDCRREATVVESLLPKTEDPETKEILNQELLIADTGDATEGEDQDDDAKSEIRIPSFVFLQDLFRADLDMTKEDTNEAQFGVAAKAGELNQVFVDELENKLEKDHHKALTFKISDSMDTDDPTHWLNKVIVAENSTEEVNEMEVAYSTLSDPEENIPSSENAATTRAKTAFVRGKRHPGGEMIEAPNYLKIIRCKRPVEELVEPREFNPRDPNYLPVEPDPEAEKVDLRHQMTDERKNAEEWMLDYALQQAVFKLAPARKRKVALLVEAFEKVIPIPKYEAHLRHKSPAFANARPIQACS